MRPCRRRPSRLLSRPARAAAALVLAALAACGPVPPSPRGTLRADLTPHEVSLAEAAPAAAVASLAGGVFADAAGAPVRLRGFSWFGFNTGTGGLDGLWQGGEPLAGDFATVVWRQALLGFNAVRLPFSFAELARPARNFSTPCRQLAAGEVGASVLPPGAAAPASGAPPLYRDVARQSGRCNGYLPTGSQREAYLWVVRFYLDNGFYVLADNHFREDRLAQTDPPGWARAWAELAAELYALPGAAGRVFLDLLNEPGEHDESWEPTDGHQGMRAKYLAAADAIEAKVPGVPIFFVEGTGQGGLGAAWGDGYATEAAKLKDQGAGDPRPFFAALAGRPFAHRVALAPHVYGPAVTGAHGGYKGAELFARLSDSFGALGRLGWAPEGRPAAFYPTAVGEFGSKFADAEDVAFMRDFAAYLNAEGAADDGRHRRIDSWFYWSWNANSGDTGGLVGDDWRTLQWTKLTYLEGLGLSPWGAATAPSTAGPKASPSAAPAPGGTLPTPPAASATTAPAAPSASSTAPAAPSSATLPPSAAAPKATARAAEGGLEARLHRDASWGDGDFTCVALNILLRRTAGPPIAPPWDLELSGPAFSGLAQAWELHDVVVTPRAITARAEQEWQHLATDAGEVNVGLTYRVARGADDAITAVRVAGQPVHLR